VEIFRRLYKEQSNRNISQKEIENRKFDELPIGVTVACILDGISSKGWKFSKFLNIFQGNFEQRKREIEAILLDCRLDPQIATTKEEFCEVRSICIHNKIYSFAFRGDKIPDLFADRKNLNFRFKLR
jgi:hypothetical protein